MHFNLCTLLEKIVNFYISNVKFKKDFIAEYGFLEENTTKAYTFILTFDMLSFPILIGNRFKQSRITMIYSEEKKYIKGKAAFEFFILRNITLQSIVPLEKCSIDIFFQVFYRV